MNNTHAEAYWGFGAITDQRQQAGESLKYLLLSQRYDSTNKQLLVDLALAQLNLYAEVKQLAEVDRAIADLRRYLTDSVAGRLPARARAQAYGHLAGFYTNEEKCARAWECVRLINQAVPGSVRREPWYQQLQKKAPKR